MPNEMQRREADHDDASDLVTIAREAVKACRAEPRCRQAVSTLDLAGVARLQLFGVGKAAPAMARGVIEGLRSAMGKSPVRRGLVVTKDEHHEGFAAEGIALRFAGHPEPDERSAEAGRLLLRQLSQIEADERVVALISGGASALLSSPVEGLDLAALREATAALIGGGVPIDAINGVRKHLTIASGGRLAAVCRAPVDVLVMSDVLGDDLAAIGSGPFAPDPTTYARALEVASGLERFPEAALEVLRQGVAGERVETPKEGLGRVRHHLVASHATLLDEAASAAEARGYRVKRLPGFGGDVHDAAARVVEAGKGLAPGEILVTGGEPTVVLPADHGKGGRNQHLALIVAEALTGGRPLRFVAMGSDGNDGPTDAAGAWVDHRTWARMSQPREAIERADAHPLLERHGQLIRTGPTGTNVLDLHLLAAPLPSDHDNRP